MFILRSPHRAYDTRYLLICNDEFSQKIGGKIDVHTLKQLLVLVPVSASRLVDIGLNTFIIKPGLLRNSRT